MQVTYEPSMLKMVGLLPAGDVERMVSTDLSTGGTREEMRAKILRLESAMRRDGMVDLDHEMTHTFAPGLYARQILMYAGSLVIGKIHKHSHVNTISKGRVTVFTEYGKKELQAPCTFVSEVGVKRVVLVHEDTVWTTYHPSDKTDLDELEADIIAKSSDELDAIGCAEEMKCLG